MPVFNILEHLDKLPAEDLVRESPSEYRYLCPVCRNDTLTIKKTTSSSFTAGAYQCWAGCLCKEIREAMGVEYRKSNVTSLNKWRSKPKEYPPLIPPPYVEFISVTPRASSFKWIADKRVQRYDYSPTQYTERLEWMTTTEGGEYKREKSFRQYSNGQLGKGDEPWDMYLFDKIPLGAGNLVVVPEGEKSVEAWWLNGIAATCPQGSCWTSTDLRRYAQQFKDKNLYPLLIPDVDLAGQRKKDKWVEACRDIGLWHFVLDLSTFPFWEDGWDCYELLTLHTTAFLIFVYEHCQVVGSSRVGSIH